MLIPLLLVLVGAALAQPTPAKSVNVDHFHVEGMKTLDVQLTDDLLAEYEGRNLTFSELEKAAQAVAELYREHDYFTVSTYLPKQDLTDGTVTIKVVEARLGDISIEGNKEYSTEYLEWMMKPVKDDAGDGLPRRSVLHRQLLLLGDEMDLSARSVVKGGETDDEVDLVIMIEDSRPIHFSLDYNNLGSKATGRNRLGATFEWGNLTSRADVLTARYVDSSLLNADVPGLNLFSIAYRTPLNNQSTHLNFSYANSAFQVGQELEVLDLRGKADVFDLSVDHTLIRRPDKNIYLSGGFVYQDIENRILGAQLSRDRLREIVLGIRGNWLTGRGRNYAGARVTQDLGSILGGMSPNDPLSSRQAGGGFTKLNFDLARVQRFNEQSYAIFRGHHQAALAPLPFAEQYGVGGIGTVRGYNQSAYLGDSGYNVNAEIRWAPLKGEHRDLLELGIFVDHGAASLRKPFPGEINSVSLNGAGIGVHLKLPHDTNLRAELGFPLGDNAITDRDGHNAVPYFIFNKRF